MNSTHFGRPNRLPMWIAGICLCAFAASGVVAIVRSIPASYASIPDEGASFKHEAASSQSEDARVDDAQSHSAAVRDTINRRSRAGCSECGFVESLRPIERFGGASGSAIAANAQSAMKSRFGFAMARRRSSTGQALKPGGWAAG